MRVALSMRVTQARDYHEPRDAISHDWIDWLVGRDHLPLPLPNRLADPAAWLEAVGAELLLLTGGNDLMPRPGAEAETAPERTATEDTALAAALARRLPVLACCRGLHLVNRHLGGAVLADLGPVSGTADAHVARIHAVRLAPRFAALAGAREIETNSFHRQGLTADQLAPELATFATAGDGVIEGAVHRSAPVLCLQWHPERPNPAAGFDDRLIGAFLQDGAFWSA